MCLKILTSKTEIEHLAFILTFSSHYNPIQQRALHKKNAIFCDLPLYYIVSGYSSVETFYYWNWRFESIYFEAFDIYWMTLDSKRQRSHADYSKGKGNAYFLGEFLVQVSLPSLEGSGHPLWIPSPSMTPPPPFLETFLLAVQSNFPSSFWEF